MPPRVLHVILYLVLRYFRKWKTRGREFRFRIHCDFFFFIPTRNDFRKMTLNHNSVAEYFLWSTKCKNFQITWKRTKIQWFSILKASLNLLNDKIFKVYSLVVHNSIYANLHFLPIFISYPHGVILWKSPLL